MGVSRGATGLGLAAVILVGLAWAEPALAAGDDSPWSVGLIASMLALSTGGLSAVLGMWIGRDTSRPIMFAFAMTGLIFTAVFVGVTQSYLDAVDGVQKRADLARMMGMIKEIAVNSGDMELAALIEAESGEKLEMPEPEPEPAADEGDDTDAPEGEEADAEGEEAEGEEAAEGGDEATEANAGEE